jgi:hypothetical protein
MQVRKFAVEIYRKISTFMSHHENAGQNHNIKYITIFILHNVKFEVFMVVKIQVMVLWVVTQCSVVIGL